MFTYTNTVYTLDKINYVVETYVEYEKYWLDVGNKILNVFYYIKKTYEGYFPIFQGNSFYFKYKKQRVVGHADKNTDKFSIFNFLAIEKVYN